MTEDSGTAPAIFSRWVRATFLGWLIGFVLVIVGALAWDLIGLQAQFMVGVGMGAGVGYMQGRVAREWLGAGGQWLGTSKPWLWSSIIGMGLPFVLWDLLAWTAIPFSLGLCVALGGLLTGLLQARLLRPRSGAAGWWPLASLAGWTLGTGAGVDALILGVILLGGLVLGIVTGGTLVRMHRSNSAYRRSDGNQVR